MMIVFNKDNVSIVREENLYPGYCKIYGYDISIDYFSGERSGVFHRECMLKPEVVGVMPYDVKNDCVVLIEQFRIGAYHDAVSPWMYELVAGIIDKKDESLTALAKRELVEETGLVVDQVDYILRYWVSPGTSNERLHLYWANVDSSKAKTICGLKEEHEDIKVHLVPFSEISAMLEDGKICNSLTIIGLQWLLLHRDKIRRSI